MSNAITFTRPSGSGHWRLKSVEITLGTQPVESITLTPSALNVLSDNLSAQTIEVNVEPNDADVLALTIDKGGEKINVGSKLDDFKIVKPLGKGHFGSVYLVTSKLTNKLYAMKEIQCSKYKSQEEVNQVEKEIKLLENLRHPRVITYFNSFKQNGNIYIIIEYINGGSFVMGSSYSKFKWTFIFT